jgi:glycosyltransferase involved in cell wall biosynthesis
VKVAFVLHGFPPECVGGTERVVETLARELRQRGHEIHVIAGTLRLGAPEQVVRGEHEGIPVTRIPRNDLYFDDWDKGCHPRVAEVFQAELLRIRPDVVHVHHWIRLSQDLVRTAAEAGFPAVASLHDYTASCPRTFRIDARGAFCAVPLPEAPCLTCAPRRPFQGDQEIAAALALYRREFQDELRSAALLLAPSRSHASAMQDYLGDPELQVEALGVPASRVLAARGARAADGVLTLAHWGNFYDLKGTHLLLRAVRAARHRERMRVVLLGESPIPAFGEQLRREAEGLAVEFRGAFAHGDLETLGADLAVFPTLCEESYGLVVDEAFMLGMPVLASDVGVFRERLASGAALLPAGDVGALAQALDRAVEDPRWLAGLRAGIGKIWSTPAEVVERLLALYGEVLSGHRRPLPRPDPVTLEERLRFLWLRSELRLASLLRRGDSLPPADTLPV